MSLCRNIRKNLNFRPNFGLNGPINLSWNFWITLNPINHGLYENLLTMGGGIWPPSHKKLKNCAVKIKLGTITKDGLRFRLNPNMTHLRSWWRHSDVITTMTSSKFVKIWYGHNFWTQFPLMMVDPSFFMFWVPLSEKIHINDVRCQNYADVSNFYLPNRRWRHTDVTWRHDVGCRIFVIWIIYFSDI